MSATKAKIEPMADKLLVRLQPELKAILEDDANARGVYGGMGEVAVRILAMHYKRPDLAEVPRRRAGRPRKKRIA